MRWSDVLAYAVQRLPIERLLVRPPSNRQRLEELQEILSGTQAKPIETAAQELPEEFPEEEGYLEPRRQKVHLVQREGGVSTEETVAYQNREIGKHLLSLEKHYAQKLTIAGKKCDCGQSRHLLGIESEAEQTIGMVDNPQLYYQLIEWVREVGPKSTVEAALTGQFEDEYPKYSRQARDFRKEIIGTIDPHYLFPNRPTEKKETVEDEREKTVLSPKEP